MIVKPDTVVRWHREGFRFDWRSISKRGSGRPPISEELQALIRRLPSENDWRARKVQVELEKLGFTLSLASVSRYLPRREPDHGQRQRWATFLRNHKDVIAGMDVFDESHLRRLLHAYVDTYNEDRVHTELRDSPVGRQIEGRPSGNAAVIGLPRVGGLHHRYTWREAA